MSRNEPHADDRKCRNVKELLRQGLDVKKGKMLATLCGETRANVS